MMPGPTRRHFRRSPPWQQKCPSPGAIAEFLKYSARGPDPPERKPQEPRRAWRILRTVGMGTARPSTTPVVTLRCGAWSVLPDPKNSDLGPID
jgi:hypothetical protein